MSATKNFRVNLRKILKQQKLTIASFAERIGMDVSKVQRLQDPKQKGVIGLDDADKIASALSTTVGYMCGNAYTDYMLDQTKMIVQYLSDREKTREAAQRVFAAEREQEEPILVYFREVLDSVDALHKR